MFEITQMQLFILTMIGLEKDIELIVNSGANVDIPDKKLSRTSLHYAADIGETITLQSFFCKQ